MKPIAIIGCGGHSKVVTSAIRLNQYNIVGYYDDNNNNCLDKINNIDGNYHYFCAIGNNKIRKKIYESYKNFNWPNIIHPFSFVDNDIQLGKGNLICAGCVIQANVNIGDQCIINTKSSIDHDCNIGSYVHVAPGVTLCGHVNVGDLTFIGAGSTVINDIKIGSNVFIGAGSNVVKNIPDKVLVYGNPCKIIKKIM